MRPLTECIQDVRLALRRLSSGGNSRYAVTVVTVLAIAIGANLAVWRLSRAALAGSAGVSAPDRLVSLFTSASGGRFGATSHLDYLDWKKVDGVFESMAAHSLMPLSLRHRDQATLIWAEIATPEYFDLLGVRPQLGRLFTGDADAADGPAVVVSHAFWQSAFAGDRGVIGRSLRLNGTTVSVVGVTPPAFRGVVGGLAPSVWIPMAAAARFTGDAARLERRNARWLQVKARLRPGVGPAQAEAALATVMAGLEQSYPDTNRDRRAAAVPFLDATIHPDINRSVRAMSRVLAGAMLLLLAVACLNVAQLTLARADHRRKELGLRMAMGATRPRLVAQLLVESIVIASVAAILGIAISQAGLGLLGRQLPTLPVPVALEMGFDWGVLLAALFFAVLAGLLSGLGPALRASSVAPVALIKEASAPARQRIRPRLQSVLIGGQVALAVVLLASAGLFLRSLTEMGRLSLGFAERRLAILTFDTSLRGRHAEDPYTFVEQVLERASAIPGVRSVSAVDRMPLGFLGLLSVQNASVLAEGGMPSADGRGPRVDYAVIGSGFFESLKLPLLEGRDFSPDDKDASIRVAIVNEAMARRFWPGTRARGRTFSTSGAQGPYIEVVGVAANAKHRTLSEDPRPFFYLPLSQNPRSKVDVVMSTEQDPAAALLAGRRMLALLDPDLAVLDAKTLDQHIDTLAYVPRAAALLFSGVGAVAAAMAAIGTYGLLAFFVERRRREIGIQMALGAGPREVLGMLLGQIYAPATAGLLAGLSLGLGATKALSAFLYGDAAGPLWVGLGAAAALLAVTMACVLPAAAALRLDPMRSLKAE